jgi:outer membrane cobalamin receptor
VSWIDQKFDLSLWGSLVGRRRDLDPISGSRFDLIGDPIFSDAYKKMNMAGAYKIGRSLTAFLRVENLLDQDYQEVLGFPAYRLNFSVGLRLRIGGGR